MAPHRPSTGGGVPCIGPAASLIAPIRLIGLVALLSGIASHVTSGALSQSPPRPRVAHLSPPVTPPAPDLATPQTPPTPQLGREDDQRPERLPSTEGGEAGGPAGNETADGAAEGRRPPPILSESILDMIDTDQVDRVLAKKRKEEEEGGRRRAQGVETRTHGRTAGAGRERGPGGHRRRSNGGEERVSEERGGRRKAKKGREKGDPQMLQRGKRPAGGKKAGRKDRSESRHRVSLSQLAKWLDISPLASYPVPDAPIPVFPDPLPPVRDGTREKILRSSKDALVVTRREYLRRDWCRTEPLIQRIKVDGCLTRSIVNGFCYGQCNSFYIPRSPSELPSSNTSLTMSNSHHALIRNKLGPLTSIPILYTQAFMSCAFCKPKEVTWVTISLRCPAIKPAQLTLRWRVERIKQCKCISEVLN